MKCKDVFLRLSDSRVTYDEYTKALDTLREFDTPPDCISALVSFVESPPHQTPNPPWYAPNILAEVMRVGSKWVYKSTLDETTAYRLIRGAILHRRAFNYAFVFDVWLFLKHLIGKYFGNFDPELQSGPITDLIEVIKKSAYTDYKALDLLLAMFPLSTFGAPELEIDCQFMIKIVSTHEYLPIYYCCELLKHLINGQLLIPSKTDIFSLIEAFLIILENNPDDNIRLEAVRGLQLIWINVYPNYQRIKVPGLQLNLRFEELKKYQKGLWCDILAPKDVEHLMYRYLLRLRDSFSMI
ncbi:MAG TPA: hypothetical protein VJ044_06325, partial [Candidatus Hodarchaeales archaeon]|nr:hypothetical protein [Candidatus Hodarchaeales archaeon]